MVTQYGFVYHNYYSYDSNSTELNGNCNAAYQCRVKNENIIDASEFVLVEENKIENYLYTPTNDYSGELQFSNVTFNTNYDESNTPQIKKIIIADDDYTDIINVNWKSNNTFELSTNHYVCYNKQSNVFNYAVNKELCEQFGTYEWRQLNLSDLMQNSNNTSFTNRGRIKIFISKIQVIDDNNAILRFTSDDQIKTIDHSLNLDLKLFLRKKEYRFVYQTVYEDYMNDSLFNNLDISYDATNDYYNVTKPENYRIITKKSPYSTSNGVDDQNNLYPYIIKTDNVEITNISSITYNENTEKHSFTYTFGDNDDYTMNINDKLHGLLELVTEPKFTNIDDISIMMNNVDY